MNFKVGDKVRVVRHVRKRRGIDAEWPTGEKVNCPIGTTGTIAYVDDDGSVNFLSNGNSKCVLGVNPESFELIKEEPMNEQGAIQYLESLGYTIQAPTLEEGSIWLVEAKETKAQYQAMYTRISHEQFKWVQLSTGNRIFDKPDEWKTIKRIATDLKEAIEKGLLNL